MSTHLESLRDWLEKCRLNYFGIILPSGWFGRPGDNLHKINDFTLTSNFLTLIFDASGKLHIEGLKNFSLENKNWGDVYLSFSDWIEIEFIPPQYGKIPAAPRNFSEGQLTLVGYFK